MRIEDTFDFKNPDYPKIFQARADRLIHIRRNPSIIPSLLKYYKDNPIQFIDDWGATFDPRNPEIDLPAIIPLVLYKRQKEWLEWVIEHWKNQKRGLTEKSRTVGLTWLSVALACTLCLFNDGMVIGFGSRKQDYIDEIGNLKAIFPRIRYFMRNLPSELIGDFNLDRDMPFMRIIFPNGSQIIGESGDGIGRGGRASMYFVDEYAFFERPQLTENSLSDVTNCQMDISTANGFANLFAEKRHSGRIDVFTFHWRDDPRRDEEWYKKKCAELDPIAVAQEFDIDYHASVAGVVIPSAWVQAATDAHIKLGITPSGIKKAALDIADEGPDKNAFCGRHGILIECLEEWSGKGSDTLETSAKAFNLCDTWNYKQLDYDGDGMGVGCRGHARLLNETRIGNNKINVTPFQGSGGVVDPEQKVVGTDRLNKDYYTNRKAQAWFQLRNRFQNTYRATVEGMTVPLDEIISIPSNLPMYQKLCQELSQPTYSLSGTGKIIINKK